MVCFAQILQAIGLPDRYPTLIPRPRPVQAGVEAVGSRISDELHVERPSPECPGLLDPQEARPLAHKNAACAEDVARSGRVLAAGRNGLALRWWTGRLRGLSGWQAAELAGSGGFRASRQAG